MQNGADSVYFGASNFNARASATNFDLSNLKKAIAYAKLRGVHTHLTLNTLIKDSELEEALLLAKKAYEFGIDAIIVQDFGLANYLIRHFPNLPIHASTQMTVHNLEGVLQAEKLGFQRVVLSRELSLEEIESICSNSNIEIETFIHGALCISYSGQCLFSSMIGSRSGNRGKCAGPCRLPYELITKDTASIVSSSQKGYLLNTKDLCALPFLPQLIKAGVMCFKIEGRMKTPEYVATVTRIYRKYIDLALSNQPYSIEKQDLEDLLQVFNRGNFSSGHLKSQANRSLIFPDKPNHLGIYVGNISNLKPNKSHVLVNLTNSLSTSDSIQFEKESTKYTISELMLKGKNISTASAKQLVEIGRMKGNLHIGDKVYRIAKKELSISAKSSYQEEHKKIPLKAQIVLKKEKPIVLTVSTNQSQNSLFENIQVCHTSKEVPIKAKSKPIEKERILTQLNKTSDTIFTFSSIDVILEEDLFLPSIKTINELRRNALEEIYFIAQSRLLRTSLPFPSLEENTNSSPKKKKKKKEISVLLNLLEETKSYESLKNVDNIYLPLKYFADKKYESILQSLCEHFNTYLYLPTIIKGNYKNLLDYVIENSIHTFNIKGFVISNLGNGLLIEKMKQKYGNRFSFIGNYTLNVYNQLSIQEWEKLGIEKLTISPELDGPTIQNISQNSNLDQELIVYGRTPLMTTNYCFLGKTNKCFPTCKTYCKENKNYYLKDRLGISFPILPDSVQTVSTIYNSKITSISGEIFPVSSYRIDVMEESIEQINHIVQTVLAGKRLEGKEYTNGNLNREI